MSLVVKICGIMRSADATAAVIAGADMLGFIFVPSSPRYVAPARVAEIVRTLPPWAWPVGVFADAPREEILETIQVTGIRGLQLHGAETPAETEGYELPVIKAFRVSRNFVPALAAQYRVPIVLVDSFVDGVQGGTGITSDWQVASKLASTRRILLSGGLTPKNVARAVKIVRPHGVDVSSGVETSPGIKDHALIREFIEAAHQAAADVEAGKVRIIRR
jgi:phosphoribosylanthranilate isomerase